MPLPLPSRTVPTRAVPPRSTLPRTVARRGLARFTLATVAAVAALASAVGSAEAALRLPPGVRCVESGPYAVVAAPPADGKGGDTIIARKPTDRDTLCSTKLGADDIAIAGPADGVRLLGAARGFVIVDDMAPTAPNTLTIRDIATGATVWQARYVDREWPLIKPTDVTLLLYVGEGTPETCPDYDKLKAQNQRPVVMERSVFDFKTLTLERLGPKRCAAAR